VLNLDEETQKAVAARLQAAAGVAWEATRRRRTRWIVEDLGPYRVALRAKRRPGRPGFWLQMLVTGRRPVSKAEAEALAKLAGIKTPILDEFPNQWFIEEALWQQYAVNT
jgi:hypothetical protein